MAKFVESYSSGNVSAVKRSRAPAFSAIPFIVSQVDSVSGVTLPMKGYRQAKNYSCGFACALMVSRHFGCSASAQSIYQDIGTNYWGTSQSQLIAGLRNQGVSVNARYDVGFARIAVEIDRGKLLIGYLEDEEHWLVIYGYATSPRRVFIADPRPDHKQCEHLWDQVGGRLGCFALICSSRDSKYSSRDSNSGVLAPTSIPSGQLPLLFANTVGEGQSR